MIKNLLFDMGGVVFIQDTSQAFSRFREAGIDPDEYMGAFGQKDFFLGLESGEVTAEEFCRRMAEATGRGSFSLDEARHCWLGFLASVPYERLTALEQLRQHYRVCLLSNTNPFMMQFTRSAEFDGHGHGIEHYFDRLFLSYEMRVCKPDQRIFRMALEAEGMLPSETIFIDDSEKNTRAASSIGIHALHVETNADWTEALYTMLNKLNQ